MFHSPDTASGHVYRAAVAAGYDYYAASQLANGLAPDGTECPCGCGMFATIPAVSPFVPASGPRSYTLQAS